MELIPGSVMFAVGCKEAKEIIEIYKATKSTDKYWEGADGWMTDIQPELQDALDKSAGAVFYNKDRNLAILILRELGNDDKSNAILVHELNHVVEDISMNLGFHRELEFKAYLQGYLYIKARKPLRLKNNQDKQKR